MDSTELTTAAMKCNDVEIPLSAPYDEFVESGVDAGEDIPVRFPNLDESGSCYSDCYAPHSTIAEQLHCEEGYGTGYKLHDAALQQYAQSTGTPQTADCINQFSSDNLYGVPQITYGSGNSPPATFMAWANSKCDLAASPNQISIWAHCNGVPDETVEQWYGQYKQYQRTIGDMEHPHLSESSSNHPLPRPQLVKCLRNQKSRRRYLASANAAARGPYICTSGCGTNFKRKADWRRHEDTNFPIEKWACPLTGCVQEFPRRHRLKAHVQKVHAVQEFTVSEINRISVPDNYHRQCCECGYTFPEVQQFYDHAVRHFNIPGGTDASLALDQESLISEDEQQDDELTDNDVTTNDGFTLDTEWLLTN
jgi:hypothetical protein